MTTTPDYGKEPHLWGHPKGLYICALTEMWERFSFYGMKFLLVLYLTQHHLFTDSEGLDVLGSYSAMVYALPLLGGMIADRYLGMRKAVLFGGIMLCLGHLGMAVEGHAATVVNGVIVRDDFALKVFYLSLSFIIVGVGFLKPNISTIVGRLYSPGDPTRDSGFTIFYMGINTGSFLATMTCGYAGQKWGWSYGFGLAGLGMFCGLILFQWGQKYLYGHAEPHSVENLRAKVAGISKEHLIYIFSVLSLGLIMFAVQRHIIVSWVLMGGSAVFLIWLVYYMVTQCTREQAHRMLVLTLLTIFTVVFWALFEQAGGSMTLFADRVMQRPTLPLMGEVTAAQFGSFNAFFIIVFAPVFAWLWIFLNKRRMEPQTPMKFALGIILAGLGFGALVFGASVAGEGKVHWGWMALAYLLHSCGELCLSPVGLSAVTKLSMPRVVGVMMGAWFLATAASEYIAALLSKLAAIDSHAGDALTDIPMMLATYTDLYAKLLYIGLAIGFFIILISPLLKKGMHGVR